MRWSHPRMLLQIKRQIISQKCNNFFKTINSSVSQLNLYNQTFAKRRENKIKAKSITVWKERLWSPWTKTRDHVDSFLRLAVKMCWTSNESVVCLKISRRVCRRISFGFHFLCFLHIRQSFISRVSSIVNEHINKPLK